MTNSGFERIGDLFQLYAALIFGTSDRIWKRRFLQATVSVRTCIVEQGDFHVD